MASDESVDGTDRTCNDCGVVIYDVSYSGENGTGYLNPEYCPLCGKPLHDDWTPCDECGKPIDFKEVSSFAKTDNDKKFWHNDCAPEIQAVDAGNNQGEN